MGKGIAREFKKRQRAAEVERGSKEAAFASNRSPYNGRVKANRSQKKIVGGRADGE